MRTRSDRDSARCILGAILPALMPFLLIGGLETHLGHAAGETQVPVFADASHAAEASHCEAADSGRISRCPACLAPAQKPGLAPAARARQFRLAAASAAAPTLGSSDDPGARRMRRPRAPPGS